MCILGLISYYQSLGGNYVGNIYLFHVELVTRYKYYNKN